MVEFALILPLLLLILFGVTEIGRALYQQNTLYKALTGGARYLARTDGIIELDGTTCDNTIDAAKYSDTVTAAKNLIVCGQKGDCGAEAIIPNLTADKVTVYDPIAVQYDYTRGLWACVIRIEAYAEFEGLFDPVIPTTSIRAFDIRAETEERYIGY